MRRLLHTFAFLMMALLWAAVAPAASTQPSTQPTTITLVGVDGKPVRGGVVVLVPVPERVQRYYVYDGDLNPWIASFYRQWRTNDQGQCAVPLPNGPAWIIAFNDQGWAHVSSDDIPGNSIKLARWGRVTGQAMHLGKPAEGWIVQVQRAITGEIIQRDPVLYNLTGRVDAQGHFSIDRVPPGATRVELLVQRDGTRADGAGGAGWLYPQIFDFAAGESHDVLLRGFGRTIEGSVTPPQGVSVDGLISDAELDHREPSPPVPYPAAVFNGTHEQRQAWFEQWKQTPAYAVWNKSSQDALLKFANYPVRWINSTTFRADEIPPGNYDLDIKFVRGLTPVKPVLTSATISFDVPPMTEGANDQPITLPLIALHRAPDAAAVGQPATDFSVTTLDGKPKRLSDYRGKFVLLDFWATWCGYCIEENPNLRETYNAFGSTGRFAILSLSYDETAAKAKAYVDAQKLPWDQCWIDSTRHPEIGEAYVHGLPTIVLIGPDGKIIATDLRGDAIKKAVGLALASN